MNSNKLLALATLVALAPMTALAVSEDTDATVSIVAALQITEDAALDFGTVVADTLTGDVTVDQAGTQSCDANLTCIGGAAADYTVTGTGNNTYSISLSNGGNVTLTGAGLDMTAALDADASDTLAGGTDTFSIGGTLTVGAGQTAGDYTGTFTVTVDYN